MLRSLFSGVSGMRNNQVRMDVIGNNIANVNTVAFKAGRVTFKEGFAQVLQSATRPSGDVGGTNPMQVGLGSQVGSIDTLFTQGSPESTSSPTDLATALSGHEGDVGAVYSWDPASGLWKRYLPGGPAYLNTMDTLAPGQVYWVQVNRPFTLTVMK